MAPLQADRVELIAPSGLPRIKPGDDLAQLIAPFGLLDADVVVLAQKIVSKSEGRLVRLSDVVPSARAIELAEKVQKDPRQVELILRESAEVVRAIPGVLITQHRLGFVMANAGIDASNVDDPEQLLLLPVDPDGSARKLRTRLKEIADVDVGIVINDSWGRAWRMGTVGMAIGAAGVPGLIDMRGQPDMNGRILRVTEIAHGDELAAAASMMMGQAAEGRPVVIVRGLSKDRRDGTAAELVRPKTLDLFR
ncbi:MAG: coenzyme F420-0:L-glutamate ligase [Alphaproteobacteria bacterium]|nr:coenzyme F420-0:L-glutamate ligase [Alphaproteobacteria bacterium]